MGEFACARFHAIETNLHSMTSSNVKYRLRKLTDVWNNGKGKFARSNKPVQEAMQVMAVQQAGIAKLKFRFVKHSMLTDAISLSVKSLRLGGPSTADAPVSMMLVASHRQLEKIIEAESAEMIARGEKGLAAASDDERSDGEDEGGLNTTMKWIIPVTGDKSEKGMAQRAHKDTAK